MAQQASIMFIPTDAEFSKMALTIRKELLPSREELEAEEAKEAAKREEERDAQKRANQEWLDKVASDPSFLVWHRFLEGDEDCAMLLMHNFPDFDPNFRLYLPQGYGASLLHFAVFLNLVKCTRHLLQNPAINVNQVDFMGRTPLCFGARSGWNEACDLLLARQDVDVNKRNQVEISPVMFLAWGGHVDGVRALTEDKLGRLEIRKEDLAEALYKKKKKDVDATKNEWKKIKKCLRIMTDYTQRNLACIEE